MVPGYYHRRSASGDMENSTCCNNTASEHYMMGRLIVDDLVHWATTYKVCRVIACVHMPVGRAPVVTPGLNSHAYMKVSRKSMRLCIPLLPQWA